MSMISDALKVIAESGRDFAIYETSTPKVYGCKIAKKTKWWQMTNMYYLGFSSSIEEAIIMAVNKYMEAEDVSI